MLYKKLFLMILVAFYYSGSVYSAELKPSIGYENEPLDIDSIGFIQFSTDRTFTSIGYQLNETIADFTLYTLDSKRVNAGEMLNQDKPLLLFAGSYTCPVYRRKLKDINDIYEKYSSEINIFIVYVVEAHPKTDISPYTAPPGKEWVTDQNNEQGVLYRQPKTYGERKEIIEEMLQKIDIKPEILIDGPENLWWDNFGPAPNNAYLIDIEGKVVSRHPWLNNGGLDMEADISDLLGNDTTAIDTIATFDYQVFDLAYGQSEPGGTAIAKSKLINATNSNIEILVRIIEKNLPPDWEISFCTDQCYSNDSDSINILLKSKTQTDLTVSFITSPGEELQGDVTLEIINKNNSKNIFQQKYFGESINSSSVKEVLSSNDTDLFKLYPEITENKTLTMFRANGSLPIEMILFDIKGNHYGNIKYESRNSDEIEIDLSELNLKSGIYFLLINSNNQLYTRKFILTN